VKRAPAIPFPVLAALSAAVLAGHLLLLLRAAGPVHVPPRADVKPFIARSIAGGPPQSATAAELPTSASPSRPVASPRERRATRELAVVAAQPAAAPEAVAPDPATNEQPASTDAPAPHGARLILAGAVRLRYSVSVRARGQTWDGEGEMVWRHDGEGYEASFDVVAPPWPARRQRSTGRITAEGLAPLRFSEKIRTEEAAHFEREVGKVIFSSNKPDAPLLPGAQDRLSVLWQLGAILAGQPGKFPPPSTLVIQTAGTREAERWFFEVQAEESLDLPGGTVEALKLTRHPRKEFDQKVEIWLAPGMDYVPVRLRLTQPNGDSVNYQWSSTDKG
jgi:hypothetical protein